ncbi:hypothetical protein [Halomarinibacterium sedimenti]|uniref:hypothetical protein n=1 Tax=Halomarinibacterium sedimenti TaxID=2857106 RepID=UPI0021069538|nr:hypothetical protein [Halomarinibacterium sedimenti]
MKKLNLTLTISFLIILLGQLVVHAQVGINTTTPDPSSILDITSLNKGMLLPRLTTAQRTAISSPANGLIVYDTDFNSLFYFNSSSWVSLSTSSQARNNHKIVKSAADLASELTAGGGSKYLLSSNTLYEINGTVSLSFPIEINNSYILGRDTNEDILVRAGGTIFTGTTGGSIKGVTLTAPGGTVFSLSAAPTQNLIFRDAIIANSGSVGSISGFGLVFKSVIQYVGNTTGITYNNIGSLLLADLGWSSNNSGTYETYTGTFTLIQKVSGFITVDGTAKGIDVSSNPTVTSGVLLSTAFSGTSTEYVKRYTTGSYTGYNFTNSWTVNCPGIPQEGDSQATANIYYNGGITTGFVQSVSNGSEFNLSGNTTTNTTTAVNLFRTSSPQNNRITYMGKKTRTFQINAALSIRGNSGTGDYYAFFIKKNGTTTLVETNSLMRVNTTSDISSQAISGTVELAPNDYVEIWGQRLIGSGTTSITVFSLNLSIK